MTENFDEHEGCDCDDDCGDACECGGCEDLEKGQDLGAKIIQKTLGSEDPEVLKTLFVAQGTPEQRKNLAKLFDGRFVVDEEK